MAEVHRQMQPHLPARTHRRRRRPWLGVAAAATLAVLGAVPGSEASTSASAVSSGPTTSASSTLSLSDIWVEPGQPVPLELIKESSKQVLGDQGALGQGIDVALIDSGVSPVVGLDQPGKLVHGPDLSNEGAFKNVARLDTFGHGTHMAGIIAGDDGDRVVGIAPKSRIVSVKVAGATGETDIAQVIAGIDWVIEHKNDNGLNIRVLNLSLGAPDVKSSIGDPLSAAVERAWHAGIVVVAAAGNRGNDFGGIDTPALSPYVIAVGATESYHSSGEKDTIAGWSSGGNSIRQPDFVTPGKSILSYRVPGSMLDSMYPTAVVDGKYFLGSGTSQSAAVTSGFVAAMLSVDPSLTPDQVKYVLQKRAVDLDKHGYADGSGRLQVKQTVEKLGDALKAPTQKFEPAISTIELGTKLGAPAGASWSGGTWNGASWSGGTWSGASWSGASWSGASWSSGVWSGASWSGASWSGASWSGASWSGASWSGASWSGASWSGASWSGASWSGASWSGTAWS